MGKEPPSKHNLLEELEKTCLEKNIPFAVVLELTYHCNLSCEHCYVTHKRAEELPLNKVKNIIDQLVEMGAFYLCFTGGEIFTRTDCLDILSYAKEKGFFLVILTNGTLINKKIADFLKDIQPSGVEISLLGASPSTHDGITGVKGSFEKTLQAIRFLIERGIYVITKTTLMKSNVQEYKEIKSLSERLGAMPKIGSGLVPDIDGSTHPMGYAISWDDRKKYLNNDILETEFLTNIEDNHNGLTCKAGKALASINPYGDVNPCVLLPIKLGNLCEKNFRDIWHQSDNNALNELRALNISDLNECSCCKLASFCGRCTGSSYLETGSIKAPSRSACEDAKWKAYQLTIKGKRAHNGSKS